MRSYFLVQGDHVDEGDWRYVICTARLRVKRSFTPVRILTGRPGEDKARAVAELDQLGERLVHEGWLVQLLFYLREKLR